MLAGLQGEDLSGSMFPHMRLDMAPKPEDVEVEAQRMMYNKVVKIKSFNVETFDLGNPEQSKAYAKAMKEMYRGIQAKTHVLLFNDRHFVEEGGKPRWIAHMEWAIFELMVTPTVPVKSAAEGDS